MAEIKCIQSLKENSKEKFLEVSAVLLKIINNVLRSPSNPKYRRLRLENVTMSKVVLPAIGAMECLFEMGFEEEEDSLTLPQERTSLDKLTIFRNEIEKIRNKVLPDVSNKTTTGTQYRQESKIGETPLAASSPSIIQSMHSMSSRVLQFENDSIQKKAKSVIPYDKLYSATEQKMREYQQASIKKSETFIESTVQETIFLYEVMKWFKNEFFTWFDTPNCHTCQSKTVFSNMSSNNHSERVEVYKCAKCSETVMFPRINRADVLLDTRTGRCGEWAMAFTLICRVLDWEARFVVDQTDHVWNEIYLKSEQRWLHCDPCECVFDKPLMYEKGWKKNLSYIFAYSCEEVQDVTWRYCADRDAVMKRRNLCSEYEIVQTIDHLTKLRQANVTSLRKKYLTLRRLKELVELLNPAKDGPDSDYEGRTSGSLMWRLARGDTHVEEIKSALVWTPSESDIKQKRFKLAYCTAKNEYMRELWDTPIKDWKSGVFYMKNIFRKEEADWKTVYLARSEESDKGTISWKFDMLNSGLVIDKVEVLCKTTLYENGSVSWLACNEDSCIQIISGELPFTTDGFHGSTNLTITAELSGGQGEVAWQHAQLFRQSLDAVDSAFQVTITLCTK